MEILFRVGHGLAHQRAGGEVQNGVGLRIQQRLLHQLGVAQAAPDEFRARIHRRAVAFREVVKHRDRVAGVEEFFRADGTDITGAAGDKDVHAGIL